MPARRASGQSARSGRTVARERAPDRAGPRRGHDGEPGEGAEPMDDTELADEEPVDEEPVDEEEAADDEEPVDDHEPPARLPASRAARAAMREIAELIGREPEGVTALQPTDGGWHVAVEVLEDRRVPSSADMLATYEADLDLEGTLMSYRRTRRYQRGRADSEDG